MGRANSPFHKRSQTSEHSDGTDISDESDDTGRIERFDATGVPGLDEILGGGLPRGALVLVMGVPGSGKTTIASQIALVAARSGRRALVLTALSESTGKLLTHLSTYSFFDAALVGGPAQFFNLQAVLTQGLRAVADQIISEVRRVKADVLMLDGFRGMATVDSDAHAAREFLFNLGTTLGALGITTLITSETDPRDPTFYPETTTADVILGLHYQLAGVRQYRGIEVIKSRGAAPMPGLHALVVGKDGAEVYAQLEERVAAVTLGTEAQTQGAMPSPSLARPLDPRRARAIFDLPELDAMLRGGIPTNTCTLLAGSLGTGKTLLAIHFALAGARAGEKTVFLGFREDREQLLLEASPFAIGPELERELKPGGMITFLEVPPIKLNADIVADGLLAEIDRTGATRLVVDSIAELERTIARGLDPARLEDYLAAFLRALRALKVTPLLVKESDRALAPTLDFSTDRLSVLAENLILLQQVPYKGKLHRVLSILKVRLSAHDNTLREFRIAPPKGIDVLEVFESEVGMLQDITSVQDRVRMGEDRNDQADIASRRERARRRKEDS
ncbi:MAG TPA: ATPase domain-containing protein [Ktedonobacterales bacterium]|nr:ATPase domain-containing protein [Ktedonobacterales bacterium]